MYAISRVAYTLLVFKVKPRHDPRQGGRDGEVVQMWHDVEALFSNKITQVHILHKAAAHWREPCYPQVPELWKDTEQCRSAQVDRLAKAA